MRKLNSRQKLRLLGIFLGLAFLLFSCAAKAKPSNNTILRFAEDYPEARRKVIADQLDEAAEAFANCGYLKDRFPEVWAEASRRITIKTPIDIRVLDTRAPENKHVCARARLYGYSIWIAWEKQSLFHHDKCYAPHVVPHEYLHLLGMDHGHDMYNVLEACIGEGAGRGSLGDSRG